MGSVCYLSMGMVVLLMGLVFASVYIYRYFFLAQVRLAGAGGGGKHSERGVWEFAADVGASRRRQHEQLGSRCLGFVKRGSRTPWTCPPDRRSAQAGPKDLPPHPPWSVLGYSQLTLSPSSWEPRSGPGARPGAVL